MSSIDFSDGSCNLIGIFGMCIQGLLATVSFSSLLVKRFRERPRRCYWIFLLDASKQGISSLLIHCMNMVASIQVGTVSSVNECAWYIICFVVDCSLGTLLNYLLIKMVDYLADKWGLIVIFLEIEQNWPPSDVFGQYLKTGEYFTEKTDLELVNGNILEEKNYEIGETQSPARNPNDTIPLSHYKVDYISWILQLILWLFFVASVIPLLHSHFHSLKISFTFPEVDESCDFCGGVLLHRYYPSDWLLSPVPNQEQPSPPSLLRDHHHPFFFELHCFLDHRQLPQERSVLARRERSHRLVL